MECNKNLHKYEHKGRYTENMRGTTIICIFANGDGINISMNIAWPLHENENKQT